MSMLSVALIVLIVALIVLVVAVHRNELGFGAAMVMGGVALIGLGGPVTAYGELGVAEVARDAALIAVILVLAVLGHALLRVFGSALIANRHRGIGLALFVCSSALVAFSIEVTADTPRQDRVWMIGVGVALMASGGAYIGGALIAISHRLGVALIGGGVALLCGGAVLAKSQLVLGAVLIGCGVALIGCGGAVMVRATASRRHAGTTSEEVARALLNKGSR